MSDAERLNLCNEALKAFGKPAASSVADAVSTLEKLVGNPATQNFMSPEKGSPEEKQWEKNEEQVRAALYAETTLKVRVAPPPNLTHV